MENLLEPVGALKSNASPTVADIGDGAKADGTTASGNTRKSAGRGQSSNNSIPTVPHGTDLDITMTPSQHQENWAQIIVDSAIEYRNAGGVARVGYAKGATVLVLPGVFYCAIHGKVSVGEECHYCKVDLSSGTGGGTDESE